MEYNIQKPGKRSKELWREDTAIRLSSGMNISNADFLPFAALGYLPKGIPLNLNWGTKLAVPVLGAVLQANLLVGDTTARIVKSPFGMPLFVKNAFIGNSTKAVQISDIDTSNAAYDLLTFNEAIGTAISAGGTLFSATALGADKVLPVHALNYADVKWKATLAAVTPIVGAMEVQNKWLPYPLTTTQITQLTSRFYFVTGN